MKPIHYISYICISTMLCCCTTKTQEPTEIEQSYSYPFGGGCSYSSNSSYSGTSSAACNEQYSESQEPCQISQQQAYSTDDAYKDLSEAYIEGYDAGYDDGEDDILSKNGYQGSYDDSCRYKGKKKRDYQQGYADGYEAGYDDNM